MRNQIIVPSKNVSPRRYNKKHDMKNAIENIELKLDVLNTNLAGFE
jgi:TATA-binding protein-associated factor Taf7